jgi:4-diphosphocytidyl-2-C-methyl-D-erythritol kinase
MTVSAEVVVRAPAKLNLELRAGGPRADGYHELATIFHAISIFDDLSAEPADELTLSVDGPFADAVPRDDSNLVLRAARLLAERAGVDGAARLRLTKHIPVAGGMAGGSADAAAALVACDTLWRAGLSRDELRELASELGSDVPFAMLGGTAVGTGRGERLTPALARGEFQWVLAMRPDGLSTPRVYDEIDRLRAGRVLPEPRVSDRSMQALRSGDPVALGSSLHNDLQPAACALVPGLTRVLAVGEDCDVLGGIVSGSGPTVAFLTRNAEHALDVAVALTASGVAADVRRAHGPVAGARLVEPVRA